jgi:hypothetical protein
MNNMKQFPKISNRIKTPASESLAVFSLRIDNLLRPWSCLDILTNLWFYLYAATSVGVVVWLVCGE